MMKVLLNPQPSTLWRRAQLQRLPVGGLGGQGHQLLNPIPMPPSRQRDGDWADVRPALRVAVLRQRLGAVRSDGLRADQQQHHARADVHRLLDGQSGWHRQPARGQDQAQLCTPRQGAHAVDPTRYLASAARGSSRGLRGSPRHRLASGSFRQRGEGLSPLAASAVLRFGGLHPQRLLAPGREVNQETANRKRGDHQTPIAGRDGCQIHSGQRDRLQRRAHCGPASQPTEPTNCGCCVGA